MRFYVSLRRQSGIKNILSLPFLGRCPMNMRIAKFSVFLPPTQEMRSAENQNNKAWNYKCFTFSMILIFEYFRMSIVCSANSFSSKLCCDWIRLWNIEEIVKICYAIWGEKTHDIASKSSWHWFWLRFLCSNLSQSSNERLSSCCKTFNFLRSASNNRKFTSNWTPNNWLLLKLLRISGWIFWLFLMFS